MTDMVLKANSGEVTMSSREIADLVDSRHDKVKQSIERLADRGVIQLPPVGEVKNHLGQTVIEYRVGKRDSYVIVAQLSPEFTARLVDRWQELEAQANAPRELTRMELLQLALDSEKQRIELAGQLALAAPKVEFVDKYVEAAGSFGFREVCKQLRANEVRFRQFLIEKSIMYRLNGTLMPYQQHIDAGRFEVKTGVGPNSHAFSQSRFTAKGLAWIARLWADHPEHVA